MPEVISKKLKFKGDKPKKKKKRSHKDAEGGEASGGVDEMAALAAADPRGTSRDTLLLYGAEAESV